MLTQILKEETELLEVMLPSMNDILKYQLNDREVIEEILLRSTPNSGINIEDLLKSHENKKAEISTKIEDEEATQLLNKALQNSIIEKKKIFVVYYEENEEENDKYIDEDKGKLYFIDDKEQEFNYIFMPKGISVNRVSQNILGPNVLGRTWLGSGYIEILDSLYGDAFGEVLQHELNHLMYPHENEMEIRARTRRQLPNPIFH